MVKKNSCGALRQPLVALRLDSGTMVPFGKWPLLSISLKVLCPTITFFVVTAWKCHFRQSRSL